MDAQDYTTASEVTVIIVKLEEHPNADRLALVRIPDTKYTAIVRKDEWEDGMLGAFVPAGFQIEDVDYFWDELQGDARVRSRTFRGIASDGILFHAPAGCEPGDDVADIFGLSRY